MFLIRVPVNSEAQPAKKDSKKKTDNNGIKKKKTRYLDIHLAQRQVIIGNAKALINSK